jgi:hypothetical protein
MGVVLRAKENEMLDEPPYYPHNLAPVHFSAEKGEGGYVDLIPRTPLRQRGGGSIHAFCLTPIEARGLAYQLLAACGDGPPPST